MLFVNGFLNQSQQNFSVRMSKRFSNTEASFYLSRAAICRKTFGEFTSCVRRLAIYLQCSRPFYFYIAMVGGLFLAGERGSFYCLFGPPSQLGTVLRTMAIILTKKSASMRTPPRRVRKLPLTLPPPSSSTTTCSLSSATNRYIQKEGPYAHGGKRGRRVRPSPRTTTTTTSTTIEEVG